MLPMFPANNGRHGGLDDAERCGDLLLRHSSRGVDAPNSAYIIIGESCVGIRGATTIAAPPLGFTIRIVVGDRSQEKMIRPHTRGVIAVVADQKARRNATVGESPCFSVCQERAAKPIAELATSTSPYPTPCTLLNARPEFLLASEHWKRTRSPLSHVVTLAKRAPVMGTRTIGDRTCRRAKLRSHACNDKRAGVLAQVTEN